MKIISGSLKGKTILLTSKQKSNENMRPTTNYSKNVLFNMLAQNSIIAVEIAEKRVLDCFCGTGAVGFEFASRGAKTVCFVDSDEHNISQVHKNAQNFKIEYTARVGFFPQAKIKEEFDIIFVDPPYVSAQSQILKTLQNLTDFSLAENGMMIFEIEGKKWKQMGKNISQNLKIILEKQASDKTTLIFFRKVNCQASVESPLEEVHQ